MTVPAPSTTHEPYVLRLSPSTVEAYIACPARWGFGHLPGGEREPGNDATEFGTEAHAERETYLEHAVRGEHYEFPNTRAGIVARALSAHLPRGMPPYGYAEVDHTYDTGEGVVLHGKPDMAWPDTRNKIAVTADYKTCGGFRHAKLEREALFGHAQAPLYTLINMRKWGYDKARALWIYAQRPPLVEPPNGWDPVATELSDHYITRDEATERVHLRMVPPAKQMQDAFDSGMTAAQAGELPKNLRNCRSFNRLCPYYQTCNPKRDQHMAEVTAEANAFLAGLGFDTPAPAAASPPPPNTNPEPAATTPVQPGDVPAAGQQTASNPGQPAINPPEEKGKRGTKRAAGPTQLDAATIEAIAEAVADKLALRLVRSVP